MNKDKVINELLIKIAKLEYEVERLDKELEIEKDISDGMLETIEKAKEYIELGINFDSLGVARTKRKLLEILDKVGDKE